jgi:hypothetical protein
MVNRRPNSKGGITSNRLRSSTALLLPPRANTISSLLNLPRATGNHPPRNPTVRHLPSPTEPRRLLNPTAPPLHPANTTRRHSKGVTARRCRRLSNHMARPKGTGNPLPSNPTASNRMDSNRMASLRLRNGNNIRRHPRPPAMARPRSLLGMVTTMRAALDLP